MDTYDGGLHLNLFGAEKLSEYFGKILVEEYGVFDHRGEEIYDTIWEEKVSFYKKKKEEKLAELTENK